MLGNLIASANLLVVFLFPLAAIYCFVERQPADGVFSAKGAART
jgi:hypothetical protein